MSKTLALDGLEEPNRFSSMRLSGAILLDNNMIKNCKICGQQFERLFNSHKYCNNCITKKCKVCNKSFLCRPSAHRKYCSYKCFVKAEIGRPAWNKGKKLGFIPIMAFTKGHKRHNQNWKNAMLRIKGKNNPAWKGGVTTENHKIRNSVESILWRETVFARDNWTCKKCAAKGGRLHAHHVEGFAKYPELRFAINNGVTLCKNCHMVLHGLSKKGLHDTK